MSRQNVTLSLDKELLGRLRVVAARRGTSVSGLLRQELERVAERESGDEAARRKALALLEQGFHLGGRPASRDQLHER